VNFAIAGDNLLALQHELHWFFAVPHN
jgi:hypothetical protein